MQLRVFNKLINVDIRDILRQLRSETNNYLFHDMRVHGKNLVVTCPYHADGVEKTPACSINIDESHPTLEYGFFNCFACHASGPLARMVADCFQESNIEFGKEWLAERFGDVIVADKIMLPRIELDNDKPVRYLSEDILNRYDYYHPYMWKRGLSKEVVDKFRIGYDKERDAITFPVYDEHHNLVFISARSVTGKTFFIDENIEKPVYLLDTIIKEHINSVYVCESQINALTLWTYGYPAVALFGTGSDNQYRILQRSGIRSYILCFDGDSAGFTGAKRFKQRMPKDVFISAKVMPRGKDVNDLSKEEFDNLPVR